MHIQQLAVIIAFNEELLDKFISLLAVVPYVGDKFQEPLKKYLIEQKRKLHEKSSTVKKLSDQIRHFINQIQLSHKLDQIIS